MAHQLLLPAPALSFPVYLKSATLSFSKTDLLLLIIGALPACEDGEVPGCLAVGIFPATFGTGGGRTEGIEIKSWGTNQRRRALAKVAHTPHMKLMPTQTGQGQQSIRE